MKIEDWPSAKEVPALYRELKELNLLEHIAELEIGNSLIGIHSGGEGKKTWTGISFQVPDVVEGAKELIASGGNLSREPEPEDDEPPHLAMCEDTEGNQIMLTRNRG